MKEKLEKFNIGYLEYLNTREELDYFKNLFLNFNPEIMQNINLYLISHLANEDDIKELMQHFNKVEFFNTSKDFDFSKIQLGIVPAIYKNNISQSAIDFVKNNVAILCGDKGEEWKFCTKEIFKFDVNSKEDFIEKLSYLASNPKEIKTYFDSIGEVVKHFITEDESKDAEFFERL